MKGTIGDIVGFGFAAAYSAALCIGGVNYVYNHHQELHNHFTSKQREASRSLQELEPAISSNIATYARLPDPVKSQIEQTCEQYGISPDQHEKIMTLDSAQAHGLGIMVVGGLCFPIFASAVVDEVKKRKTANVPTT